MYEKLGEMTNAQFMSFIDPKNHISRLLIMHMFFLDFEMSLKVIGNWERKPTQLEDAKLDTWVARKDVTSHWIQQIQSGLPEEYKPYGDWIAKRIKYRL